MTIKPEKVGTLSAATTARQPPPLFFEGFEQHPDKREVAERALKRHAAIMPPWIHEAVAGFCETSHQGEPLIACEASCQYDYRRLHVWIYPCFWTSSFNEQDKIIRHEIVHALIAPLEGFAKRMLKLLDEPLRSAMEREIMFHQESVVEDVSAALGALQPPGPARREPTLGSEADG